MCKGPKNTGPSAADLAAERARQDEILRIQTKTAEDARIQAAKDADASRVLLVSQYENTMKTQKEQYEGQLTSSRQIAEDSRARQEDQFAQAQAAQQAQLEAQLAQQAALAKQAEEAANRALTMKTVGDDLSTTKVSSKTRNTARKRAAKGTSQLTNTLGGAASTGISTGGGGMTISMGGG
jgi:hypothetical protein